MSSLQAVSTLAACLAIVSGCSSSSNKTPSLDASTRPGADASRGDSGKDADHPDAARRDAASDVATHPHPGDAGSDASDASDAAVPCPGVFCEDFETGELNAAVWTTELDTSGATFAVESTKAAHGKYAAHFHVEPTGRTSRILETVTAPQLPSQAYGRAYFYLSPDAEAGHTDFFASHANVDGGTYELEIGEYHAEWQLNYQWSGGEAPIGTGTLPVNTWGCITWMFERSPSIETAYGVGSTDGGIFDFTSASRPVMPAFTDTVFGIQQYGDRADGTPIDVYIDDIVLGKDPVGCLP